MSFYDVLSRGDEALEQNRPRNSKIWNFFSHLTCKTVIGASKIVMGTLYDVEVKGLNNLDDAMIDARKQDRGIMTVMNHMSTCDDPFLWACFPWRNYKDLDDIRWGLAATNICFTNIITTRFFSLGKILPCDRFGRGPFQPGLDACVRLLSPDDTLDEKHIYHNDGVSLSSLIPKGIPDSRNFLSSQYSPPVLRKKTSLVHVFPEGFVCQLQSPFNNSMRFFRWGTARMILEPTVAPVIVPIFSDGFEKIKPEKLEDTMFDFFTFYNRGSKVTVNIGKPLDSQVIESFRDEWKRLCDKYHDVGDFSRMTDELKFGEEARKLRSKVSAYLREQVARLRIENGFSEEDPRFSNIQWWSKYTASKGESDKEVKFMGLNWAVRDYQKNVVLYDDRGREVK
ncbi:DEKNAAC101542 [Brettanomyces naardenensis]|uniref:Tafazzin family protein n=1 Tax=Brettanomyces naardenensis TaxID=13370 RepID=A0A448YI97_BRENA|nr:DEKNAAC101542 [Brettanomyces naardenensis]